MGQLASLAFPLADVGSPPPRSLVPRIPRIFVVDDDELFCRHLQKVGRTLNISVRTFHPDRDFGRLPVYLVRRKGALQPDYARDFAEVVKSSMKRPPAKGGRGKARGSNAGSG